jgi:hypothetical protein
VFDATASYEFFEYFRIPYTIIPPSAASATNPDSALDLERVSPSAGTPGSLGWFSDRHRRSRVSARAGPVLIDSTTRIFARVFDNALVEEHLRRTQGSWRAVFPLHSERGDRIGSVWMDTSSGSILLPFDPNEAILLLWSEKYQNLGQRRAFALVQELARRSYYRMRPLLPREAQLKLRRGFRRVQARPGFPRWPIETALHDLYNFLLLLLARVAEAAVPYIAPWPRGYSWAFVLTHDVERTIGYKRVKSLHRLEVNHGYRSAFYFVPLRDYRVDDDVVSQLEEDGFEVGVHGVFHDGRDVESSKTLEQRLPLLRSAAAQWRSQGFRSPSTLRRWDLVPALGFDYDTSYSDTAPFEPQAGGSCSWLPYMNENVVELPITLVQDHTIFELLGRHDEALWIDKARFLRKRHGMALILTHPDYLESGPRLDAYARFLQTFVDDSSAWKALPREVSSWWRQRAASSLVRDSGAWKINGPAADEAAAAFVTPPNSIAEIPAAAGSADHLNGQTV